MTGASRDIGRGIAEALAAQGADVVINYRSHISSIHQELAFPGSAAYNMSKAAVNHLVRTMAIELAPHRINANVVNPGWIDTPGERAFYSEADLQRGAQAIPWKRMGTVDDIGAAVVYLVSDAADYITGTTLRVDGGFMVGLSLPEAAA